jgi:outer membrane receptor protein involved in Fe transport
MRLASTRLLHTLFRPAVLAALGGAVALVLCLAGGVTGAWAQGATGRIAGSVVDKKNGRAIAFANIAIPELKTGALSDSKGDFLIGSVPPGTYTLKVQFTGYGAVDQAGVTVVAGQVASVKITMEEIVVKTIEQVEVKGTRPLVDTKAGGTRHTVTQEDIGHQGLQNLNDVVAQQAGVSNENGLIRVRGGRADETTFFIDGVASRNPISGESTAGSINARSVAEVSVISSGFSARYGQALSGIVDVKLKEGGQKLEGGMSAQGGSWFTQNYNGTISGPDWFMGGLRKIGLALPGESSFLLDLSSDFSNTYLPNIIGQPGRPRLRSGYEDSFLGFKFKYSPNIFMPAEENNWSGNYKWTWKPSNKNKVDIGYSKRIAFDQGFNRRPISDLSGQSLSYPWLFHDRLEHYGTITEDVNTLALTLTHTISPNAYHTLQISRYFTGFEYAVDGKKWTDYNAPDDLGLPPGQDRPYFVDSGDDNLWTNYWSENLSTDYRLGINFGKIHKAEFGIQNSLQNVQYVTIIDPWVFDPDGLGRDHDLWHVYPDQGAFYATDRLEFEGFVAEAGARVDYWFPGKQLERAVADTSNGNISSDTRAGFYKDSGTFLGSRVKAVMSPRVSVSHPIQNKDKFFFNFGQFTQFPSYYYVYSKLTSVSSAGFPVLGNANLNPEKSVQFEVGAQHVFPNNDAGKITLFQKDIYDYPTSVLFHRQEGTVISDFFAYLNSDFSRARGFELEYESVRKKYWKYRGSYEFSVAKGKSSDPNQAKIVEEGGGDASEPPLSEGYLFWNRPHKFTVNADFRVPEKGDRPKVLGATLPHGFGVNLFGTVESGKAYTPTDINGNATGRVYSQNGPIEIQVNMRINQDFAVSRENRMNFYLVVENLLNQKIVKRLDASTGEAPMAGAGQYQNPTQYDYNSVLTNPGIYGPPLRVRLGLDYDF